MVVVVVVAVFRTVLVKAPVSARAFVGKWAEVLVINILSAVAFGEFAAMTNDLTGEMVSDAEISALAKLSIALESPVTVGCSVDALSDAVVDVLTGALVAAMIDILPDSGSDVFADTKINAFLAFITTLDFAMPAP